MRLIEILRSRYVLQLLILSTGTRFQRVSEHYMVTRTFLLILTLERGLALTSARYNSMECRPTQGFLPVHLVKGLLWSYITTHRPGIADPPHYPQQGKKFLSPLFMLRPNHHQPKREKTAWSKNYTLPSPPANMYLT